uniref:Splicing factor YJU2 n=1 Tax=Palpitomonas bilix TaxID=652834 RepID=A0A7S3CVB7_9EUKA|mmetsp:Transcript_10582/g.27712  ORF Transcript_10582/g.27712 Transcript_10582/m.27712 type:complete len:288 (+) Transcript_10582:80-943(+)
MGERKVLNKYYPPDFDPSAIPKGKRKTNTQVKVRMMLPMSLKCNNCGEYMARGTKFNSRKETAENEDYLGIPIFRFYFKCRLCSSEITFKTDPRRSDYQTENGASRSYEPFEEVASDNESEEEEEDTANPMKTLEEMTMTSKKEMDLLDALDEMKSQNARRAMLSPDDILRLKHTSRMLDDDGHPKEGLEEGWEDSADELDEQEAADLQQFREEQSLRALDATETLHQTAVKSGGQHNETPAKRKRRIGDRVTFISKKERKKAAPPLANAAPNCSLVQYSSDSDAQK